VKRIHDVPDPVQLRIASAVLMVSSTCTSQLRIASAVLMVSSTCTSCAWLCVIPKASTMKIVAQLCLAIVGYIYHHCMCA
jgi:hypothetical protein